jgi:hypothetical protein
MGCYVVGQEAQNTCSELNESKGRCDTRTLIGGVEIAGTLASLIRYKTAPNAQLSGLRLTFGVGAAFEGD